MNVICNLSMFNSVFRLDTSCQVPLSKSTVFFLNISWFGMNVMYLILSVEGEKCSYNHSEMIFPVLKTNYMDQD